MNFYSFAAIPFQKDWFFIIRELIPLSHRMCDIDEAIRLSSQD